MPKPLRYPKNLARTILRQPGVGDMTGRKAREVADNARTEIGPGDFADSLDVERGKDKTRHYARVTSDDPGLLAIEFGTSTTEPKAPLRRAIDRAGLSRTSVANR